MSEGFSIFLLGGLLTAVFVLAGFIFNQILRRLEHLETEIANQKTLMLQILTNPAVERRHGHGEVKSGAAQTNP